MCSVSKRWRDLFVCRIVNNQMWICVSHGLMFCQKHLQRFECMKVPILLLLRTCQIYCEQKCSVSTPPVFKGLRCGTNLFFGAVAEVAHGQVGCHGFDVVIWNVGPNCSTVTWRSIGLLPVPARVVPNSQTQITSN